MSANGALLSVANRPAGSRSKTVESPRWQQAPARRRGQHRRQKIGVAGLMILCLLGTIAWLSTWLNPPRPVGLVLIGAGYQENPCVPHNVYGWRGLESLAALTRASGTFSSWGAAPASLRQDPVELRRETDWRRFLDDCPERTLVLVIACHGAADHSGPYLLPNDATTAAEPANRLHLVKVIDQLAKLPAEKHKVLILDATQVPAHWPLGILHNDFSRQLAALESRITAVPNLVVLCSAGFDERSWVSEEWQQTIFSHTMIEGLKGAAKDAENDGRINALELYRYVRGQVQGWVHANRDARQVPMLLPTGTEGEQRAARIDLAVVRSDYRPPDPHDTPVFNPPSELVAAWETHQRIAEQVPAPAVHAPHLWRQYQETLLRYERLISAADPNSAARLQQKLKELELQIEQARGVSLSSMQNSLSMPAVIGWNARQPGQLQADMSTSTLTADRVPDQSASRIFGELWSVSQEAVAKRWQELQAEVSSDATARCVLRLQVCDLLVQRAEENPAAHLSKAAGILSVLGEPLRPSPAEVHLLLMLSRNLQLAGMSGELSDLVQLALRVRRAAERAAAACQHEDYCYSAQVAPWTRAQVDRADADRRVGEDLLFADSQEWPRARSHLESALRGYRNSLADAHQVQQALATRDRVLASLPFYSIWIARRGKIAGGSSSRDSALLQEALALWANTHELVTMLETVQPPHDVPRRDPYENDAPTRRLAEQTKLIRAAYDQLESLLLRWWQELSELETPGMWRDAEDALVVPHLDPQMRMRLLRNKRRTSRQLLIETTPFVSADITAEVQASRAKDCGQRQGQLCLAVLGERCFRTLGEPASESYDEVRHRLEVFTVEHDWSRSLISAGEQILTRLRAMPEAINKQLRESEQAKPIPAFLLLQASDRLASQINGAGAADVLQNPSKAYHDRMLQEFLLWQAQRTLEDHWFGDDSGAIPYFRCAGLLYVSDARRLVQGDQRVEQLQTEFDRAAGLTLDVPSHLDLTDESRGTIDVRIKSASGPRLLAGNPVVWIEAGKALTLESPRDGQRLVRPIDPERPTSALSCTFASPPTTATTASRVAPPGADSSALTIHAFFRGERIAITVPVDVHRIPTTTLSLPPPLPRASLAVRAAPALHQEFGMGSGAVVIVLDCSGSMGPAKGEPFSQNTKFAEATSALKRVLQLLPAGTTVSLWCLGQALGPGKTAADAERTIRQIHPPTIWNPGDESLLARWMAQIEYPALEPWNESPIVRAILAAKEDLLGVVGAKSMFVVTDGMDNRFERDKTANPKQRDIPTVLREAFDHSGIQLNIVGFKVVSHEQARAHEQFGVVETLFPPGRFLIVDDGKSIEAALSSILRAQLRYTIETIDNRRPAGVPDRGLEIARTGSDDQWLPGGLAAGSYQLRLEGHDTAARQVIVNRGDRLLMELSQTPSGVQFQRLPYVAHDYAWKPTVEQSGWRAAILQNQRIADRQVQLLLALEKQPEPHERCLQQIWPREVWLEVTPKMQTSQAATMQWCSLDGYPVPSWGVDLGTWPVLPETGLPAPPRIRLWWNPDRQTAPALVLERGHDFAALPELAQRSVFINGDEATLETVQVEEHTVEVRPGIRELQPCLVVRVRHSRQRPLLSSPEGIGFAGSEHRFYDDIGRYTGLFWPVSADEAAQGLRRLGLVSIESLKREATQRGYYCEFNDLPAPQLNDERPRAP